MQYIVRFITFIAVLLILTQCSKKTSPEYVQEGMDYTKNQKYADAMKAFLNAVDHNKKNPDAYYGLGGIYNQKEMYPQASEAFLTAIQLDPTYVDAYYSLGYSYEMMGNKEAAKKYYEEYRAMKKKLDGFVEKERKKS